MQKGKLWDVASQNHHADCQGRRQDQASGSPQHGPKDGSHQQRQRRDAHVRAVEPGFDEVGHDQFETGNQKEHQQGPEPSIKDSQRKRDRQCRRNQRSHIGHDPQDAGDHSP